MNLQVAIDVDLKNDYRSVVTVTDSTYGSIDSDGYTDESYDYSDGIIWDHFKWSDTCTINIIKKITSKMVKGEPYFNMHLYINDEGEPALLDTDSIRYIPQEDGYYTIDHIVLPTTTSDWFNAVQLLDPAELDGHKIYVTDGSEIYWYNRVDDQSEYKLDVVTLDYIISVGQKRIDNENGSETISMNSFSVFCIDHLRECYKNVACDILNHCIDPCNQFYESKRFIRDFLWMTMNVIDIYLKQDLYTEAQIVLEKSQSYNSTYPTNSGSDSTLSPGGGCGCHRSSRR